MNKLIFGGILSLLISGNLPAAAQQPGQYVRKALPQPAFFVPQKDIQYQEKLPPFNLPPQPAEVKVQTTVEKVQYSEPAFPTNLTPILTLRFPRFRRKRQSLRQPLQNISRNMPPM